MPRDPFAEKTQTDVCPRYHHGRRMFGGRYTLLQQLGKGGMGEVWLAQDNELAVHRALKFSPLEVADNAHAVAMLKREVIAGTSLSHPHIVRIFDFVTDPNEGEGAVVMEAIEGNSLAELQARRFEETGRKFFEPWEIAGWLRDVCAALDYAHSEGRMHRDLKPENLMVVATTGRIKVMDFGISHVVGEFPLMHAPKQSAGTLAYMSPQQVSGNDLSTLDDIYSLGATIYDLLTGSPPFSGESADDLRSQILANDVPPLGARLLELYRGSGEEWNLENLNDIIMRSLSGERGQRPATAEMIGKAFDSDGREPESGNTASVSMSETYPGVSVRLPPNSGRRPQAAGGQNRQNPITLLFDLCGFHRNGQNWSRKLRGMAREQRVFVTQSEIEALHAVKPAAAAAAAGLIRELVPNVMLVATPRGKDRLIAMAEVVKALAARGHRPVVVSPDREFSEKVWEESGIAGASHHSVGGQSSVEMPSTARKSEFDRMKPSNHQPDRNDSAPPCNPAAMVGCERNPERVRVLIDTSAFMFREMPEFCRRSLLPWAAGVKRNFGVALLAVPVEAKRELANMANLPSPPENPERQEAAMSGLRLLHQMQQADVVQIFEVGQASKFQAADDIFISTLLQLLLKYHVLLMTQDKRLARICMRLHTTRDESEAYEGRKNRFTACRLHRGRLERHFIPLLGSDPQRESPKPPQSERPRLRKLTDDLILASPHPGEGSAVITERGQRYFLHRGGMRGGEGIVYPLIGNEECVAKIYHREQLKQWRMEKLVMMLKHPVSNRGVAWPTDILCNEAGQRVGFLMPRVQGAVALGDSVFSLTTLAERFPRWNRRDLVILARNLSSVVSILHKRSEVIGDLNPANILVVEEHGEPRIRLVDADSWQFDGYPSPVGMQEYTHPALRGRNFSGFLREQDHDLYALAVILFQILFAGRHPFAAAADMSLADCMKDKAFPYPLGTGEDRDKVPKGFAWNVWTHLPRPVQQAFYLVFAEGRTLQAEEWVRKLDQYGEDIVADRLDKMGNSNRIKPTASRVPRGRAGDEAREFQCTSEGCANKETFFGKVIIEKMEQRKRYRCRTCIEKLESERQHGSSRICSNCECLFSHPIWFEQMIASGGLQMSATCPQCGGLQSQFVCADCSHPFSVNVFDVWQRVVRDNVRYCPVHHRERRASRPPGQKFLCVRCKKSFEVHEPLASSLAAKPSQYVVCFQCRNSS